MNNKKFSFLKGGEMGELISKYDWSKTSAGAIESWPVSLRVQISLMLQSKFPMLIFWGKDLITFYNDAFRPSLGEDGKHPGSLGQKGEQSWAESWPVIGPMIYNIMDGGDAVYFEDQKLPLYREGKMGYAYWTYSFSAILDDAANVNGILVNCFETTKGVESLQQTAESEAALRNAIELAELGTWSIDLQTNVGILSQKHVDMFGLGSTNPSLEEIFTVIHPEDVDRIRNAVQAAVTPGSDGMYEAEYRIVNGITGNVQIIHAKGQTVFENGQAIRISGTSRDITLERALQTQLENKVKNARKN